MTISQAFVEHCHAKAARFLKSVVIVDDEITWEKLSETPAQTASKPGVWAAIEGGRTDLMAISSEPSEIIFDSSSHIEIEAFTRSFSQHGIVAGFLRPNVGQNEIEKNVSDITRLSYAADVLLIDWKLNIEAASGQEHQLTIDAIRSILRKDTESGGRVRLIVIYTSESTEIVQKQLAAEIRSPMLVLEPKDSDRQLEAATCFSYGHGLIAIISKAEFKYSEGPSPQVHDVVVRLFSKLNRGLLASTALDAIAAVREKTHHLLANFGPEYDGAFVAHRCLIASPEDSEEFAEKLISDEIGVAIALQRVGASGVSHSNVMSWVKSQRHSGGTHIESLSKLYQPKDKDKHVRKLLNVKTNRDTFAKFFPDSAMDPARKSAVSHFSCLSLLETDLSRLKSYGANWVPYLTLGSLVFSNDEYYLCLIPRCDSVRISDRKAFPFLRLTTVVGDSPFDLVIPRNGNFVQLSVAPDSDFLSMVEFLSNGGGYIEAKFCNERYIFHGRPKAESQGIASFRVKLQQRANSSSRGKGRGRQFAFKRIRSGQSSVIENSIKKVFEWVGELKNDKALQFAQSFANQLNRVGPDDFEPLRLSSKKR